MQEVRSAGECVPGAAVTGVQVVALRKKIGCSGSALAELADVNQRFVSQLETGAGKVSKRARGKIIGTLLRLRDLQERWGGVLNMRDTGKVRELLQAMGDGQPKVIPQLTNRDDIAAACATLAILPVELNMICSLRDGLLATARFFSRPCQRWILAHVAAIRDVLADNPKFFTKYGARGEAVEVLAELVRVKLTKEIGVSQYSEYVLGLKLTGESREAQVEESRTAS